MDELERQHIHSPASKEEKMVKAGMLANQAVLSIDPDDFLPVLGQWSETLGHRVLITAVASVLLLSVWPWRETIRVTGIVRPAGENTTIQSQLDGTLSAVWVKQNQQVQQGEALAALDRNRLAEERQRLLSELRESMTQQSNALSQQSDQRQQLEATEILIRAQQRSAERDVDSAEATVRYRQAELQRYRNLFASGAISLSLVDEKSAQFQLAANDLTKMQQALRERVASGAAELARLRQGGSQTINQSGEFNKVVVETRSKLADVERALANSVIKAPIAGTVIMTGLRHAKQVIRSGDVLAEIAPIQAKREIKAKVFSRDIDKIRRDQTAFLRVSGCPYPEYGVLQAKVLSISADTVGGVGGGGAPQEGGVGSGASAYEVSMEPVKDRLGSGSRQCVLRYGMDVEADVVTRNTTILSFLLTKLRLLTGS